MTKAKISIAITVAGSIVIAMADGSAGGNSLYGDFLALLSALFSTVYTLIGKQVRKNLSTTAYTFIVYFEKQRSAFHILYFRYASFVSGCIRQYIARIG